MSVGQRQTRIDQTAFIDCTIRLRLIVRVARGRRNWSGIARRARRRRPKQYTYRRGRITFPAPVPTPMPRAARNVSVDATNVSWSSMRVYVCSARRFEIAPRQRCRAVRGRTRQPDHGPPTRDAAEAVISGTGFNRTKTMNLKGHINDRRRLGRNTDCNDLRDHDGPMGLDREPPFALGTGTSGRPTLPRRCSIQGPALGRQRAPWGRRAHARGRIHRVDGHRTPLTFIPAGGAAFGRCMQ